MRRCLSILLSFGPLLSGCASFYPVDTTPAGIRRVLRPGDTVRLTTRDRVELRMLVIGVDDYDILGRVDGRESEEKLVPFDRIDGLSVQRLNMRKALFGVVLPVVGAAVVACQHEKCRTHSVVEVRY